MFSLANTTNVPDSIITESGGITQIDSRGSSSGGVLGGGTSGVHEYTFTSSSNIADILAGETQLTIVAGSNASESGGVWSKSTTGTGWNASISSVETFDSADVWAMSWEVSNIFGTIRQMSGLSSLVGDHYNRCSHAIYQVNSYFYSTVYESGSGRSANSLDNANKYPAVGDRFGMMCSNGTIKYFVMKGTNVYVMHTSDALASGNGIGFKGCMNRGTNVSGTSEFTKAWIHNTSKQEILSSFVRGIASDPISQPEQDQLAKMGMVVESGSTYSNIFFTRTGGSRYDNGSGTSYDVNMTHQYEALLNQDLKTLSF